MHKSIVFAILFGLAGSLVANAQLDLSDLDLFGLDPNQLLGLGGDQAGNQLTEGATIPTPSQSLQLTRRRVSSIVNSARAGQPGFGVETVVIPEDESDFLERLGDMVIESIFTGILENIGTIDLGGDDQQDQGAGGGTIAPPEAGPFPF